MEQDFQGVYEFNPKEYSLDTDFLFSFYRPKFAYWISYVTNGACGDKDIVLRGSMYEFTNLEHGISAFIIKGGQGLAEIEKTLAATDVKYKIIFRINGAKILDSYANGIVTADIQRLAISFDKNSAYSDALITFYEDADVAQIIGYPNGSLVQTMVPSNYVAIWNLLTVNSPAFILYDGTTNMPHIYQVRA